MYPLLRGLAAEGIPVAVTCRVLEIARQPHDGWPAEPMPERLLDETLVANAIFDAPRGDPDRAHTGHRAARVRRGIVRTTRRW